jgi:hypothetical protein
MFFIPSASNFGIYDVKVTSFLSYSNVFWQKSYHYIIYNPPVINE